MLVVFALLALLLGLQSSDRVLWTGQQVVGTEQQGIVTYWWHGQSYSLDEPGFGFARAVSVYLDRLTLATQWSTVFSTGRWLAY